MKSIFLLAFWFTTATVAVHGFSLRSPCDVFQLNPDNTSSTQTYLQPSAETNEAEVASDGTAEKSFSAANDVEVARSKEVATIDKNEHDSAVFEPQVYVHKTMQHLRFRTLRDVSHLSREYLPPASIRTPAIYYLPPVENVRTILKPNNEYLPPVEPETEAPQTTTTEAPTTAMTTEAVTELPTTQAPIVQELIDDTAILDEDGYHYKKPDVVPDLYTPVREYLPSLEDGIVVENVPFDDESTTLNDDGYRYPAIRRFRS